jgi:hypothetical protein
MGKAYEVTVNVPSAGKGTDLEIPGLGVFKNGTTTVLEDEEVATFRQHHAGYGDDGEYQLGPTPLQANFMEGIDVEYVDYDPPPPPDDTLDTLDTPDNSTGGGS